MEILGDDMLVAADQVTFIDREMQSINTELDQIQIRGQVNVQQESLLEK